MSAYGCVYDIDITTESVANGLVYCDQELGTGVPDAYVCYNTLVGSGVTGYGYTCYGYCPDTATGINFLNGDTPCCSSVNTNGIYSFQVCNGQCISSDLVCCGTSSCISGSTCMADGSCCASGRTVASTGLCCVEVCGEVCLDDTGSACCSSNVVCASGLCKSDDSCCATSCGDSCLDDTGTTCCNADTGTACTSNQTCLSNGSCCTTTCGTSCLDTDPSAVCCGDTAVCATDEQCIANTCELIPVTPTPNPAPASASATPIPDSPIPTPIPDSPTPTPASPSTTSIPESPTPVIKTSTSSPTPDSPTSTTSTSTPQSSPTSTIISTTRVKASNSPSGTITVIANTAPDAACFLPTQFAPYYTTPDWYRSLPPSAQSIYSSTNAAASESALCTSTVVVNPQFFNVTHHHNELSTGAKAGISIAAILLGVAILVAAVLAYLKSHIFKGSKTSESAVIGTEKGAAAGSSSMAKPNALSGSALHSIQPTSNGIFDIKNPASTTATSYGQSGITNSSSGFAVVAPLTAAATSMSATNPANNDHHRHPKRRKHMDFAHHHHLFPGHACSSSSCPLLAPGHVCKEFDAKPIGPCTCADKNCELNNKEHECEDDENQCFCEEDGCPDTQRAKMKEVKTGGASVVKGGIKGAADLFSS